MKLDTKRRRTCGGGASDPALVTLSMDKLRRVHPELCGIRGLMRDVADGIRMRFYGYTRLRLMEWLYHGDSRAALVVSTSPLLVAAYTDEMDCVAMLRFPDDLGADGSLRRGSRLLTANSYMWRTPERPLQPDLVDGPASTRNKAIVFPFICDFLSDDLDRITERKAQIKPAEWQRAATCAGEYLKRPGCTARDGRPLYCEGDAYRVALSVQDRKLNAATRNPCFTDFWVRKLALMGRPQKPARRLSM
jgi:hypothetical protein